jgi:hypothetical protein
MSPPSVTIAGAGLAGLTAALRLAERGYAVKLYERKPILGGNLGSRPTADGGYLDVYPHMYGPWYHNFWRLLDDVTGLDRDQLFSPFSGVKQLRTGDFPKFTGLVDPYSPWRMFQNLFSGVGAPADMFAFGYANVDLMAEQLQPTMLPDDVTVGGFMNARPYMTERAAQAFDSFITTVWAIPSYLVSAQDYRTYLGYCLAEHEPPFLLARGSAYDQVVRHLERALEAAGVEIVRSVQLTSVSCEGGRVKEIGLQRMRFDPKRRSSVGARARWSEAVDELILAVPAAALSALVRTGKPGARVVEASPKFAELSRLRAQAIPILHVYFKHQLRGIPPAPVGLYGSSLGLAFTDISQTWQGGTGFEERTVLAVSSSDPFGLPGTGENEDAMAILRELAEYLEFEPGERWGESAQIDWKLTDYHPNSDAQLFVNEVGTDACRPEVACAELDNLFLAGDFCANRIGLTTIESAVTTGLEAAAAIVERRGIGAPVEIADPRVQPGAYYVWLRYVWGPYAMAAKMLSEGRQLLSKIATHLVES